MSTLHSLLFEFCTVLFLYQIYIQVRFKMRACFVSSVFYFSKNSSFHFYIAKDLKNLNGIFI